VLGVSAKINDERAAPRPANLRTYPSARGPAAGSAAHISRPPTGLIRTPRPALCPSPRCGGAA